ncbi:MAG: AAA family ATPase [Chlamydiota bacterium]|nr:AAA family ATPase [Chlamydiota bacterium]
MSTRSMATNLEDIYLKDTEFPLNNENYVVISGCSGGGKSSILTELANRGYSIVLEPGRQIVKEQTAIDGDALPWTNLDKFLELALSRYLLMYNSEQEKTQFVFFDRSIIDALLVDQSQPKYFENAAKKFRYNRLVFLVPPWKEIYVGDKERKHGFEEAFKEFNELLIKYKKYGYETVLIPKLPVKERVDFILEKLNAHKKAVGQGDSPIEKAKRLLEWNKQKLTSHSNLDIEDISELFAKEFIVIANERRYDANHHNYYDFLNKFRSNIKSIDYDVQEYISTESTVVMPLSATVTRTDGTIEVFDAILLIKLNDSGKIVHWQEAYSKRP